MLTIQNTASKKGKLSQERHMQVTNANKLSKITAYVCKHVSFSRFLGNIKQRNKKCEKCYSNFALWKIETIVDVKRQNQPPIEMFRKLNGLLLNLHFCSFNSLVLNNRLNNLKRFLFWLFYFNFPLLKWKPIFLANMIDFTNSL